MPKFSSTDMAFEGIRLARENPKAILAWAAVELVGSLIGVVLLVMLAGQAMMKLQDVQSRPGADPTELLGALSAAGPGLLLVILIALVTAGVIYAAVNRAVLRPSEGGFGYLGFGKAELLQALLLIVFSLLLGVIFTVAVLLAALLAGAVGAASDSAGALVGVIASIAAVCFCIWIGVRLSLASPLTFAEGRLQIFSSWRVTKDRFWSLFGGYLLAVVLIIVVYMLVMVLFVALTALVGGGLAAAGRVFEPDMSSLGAYFTLPVIIYTPIAALVSGLINAIAVGAAADAYRQITGEDGAPSGEPASAALAA